MQKRYLGNNIIEITFISGNTVAVSIDDIKELLEDGIDVVAQSYCTAGTIFEGSTYRESIDDVDKHH